MQFIVTKYDDGTVDVKLGPDTKSWLKWNGSILAVGVVGFAIFKKLG